MVECVIFERPESQIEIDEVCSQFALKYQTRIYFFLRHIKSRLKLQDIHF